MSAPCLWRNRLVIVWSTLFGASCGPSGTSEDPEARGQPSSAFRDSAGIMVVESTRPVWKGREDWVVPGTASVTITGGDGAQPLFRVRGATMLQEGLIVVGSEGTGEVSGFDSFGKHLYSVGSLGDGPTQFRRLTTLQPYRGDSVAVLDSRLGRISIIDGLTGSFGRAISLRLDGHPLDLRTVPDGRFVLKEGSSDLMSGPDGLVRADELLLVLGPGGQIHDTLASLEGRETFVFDLGDARPPFAKDSHFAVFGDRVFFGDADGSEYETLSLSGDQRRIVRIVGRDLEVSPAQRDAAERDILSRRVPPAFSELPERMVGALPTRQPGYDAFLVDSHGNVWLRAYAFRRGAVSDMPDRSWLVFDSRGVWLGLVPLPAALEPFEIGSDYVLGRWEGPMGVESVRRVTLRK